MSVTRDTSQMDRSWLKEDARLNMDPMLVTADTSHFDRSWLKADARMNMDPMSVTADTSHFDRSVLNSDAYAKMDFMLVTALTSQSLIDPCSSSGQSPIGEAWIHSLTASWSCFSDSGLNAAVARVRK